MLFVLPVAKIKRFVTRYNKKHRNFLLKIPQILWLNFFCSCQFLRKCFLKNSRCILLYGVNFLLLALKTLNAAVLFSEFHHWFLKISLIMRRVSSERLRKEKIVFEVHTVTQPCFFNNINFLHKISTALPVWAQCFLCRNSPWCQSFKLKVCDNSEC